MSAREHVRLEGGRGPADTMLAVLTGIDASKLTYYTELKSKVRELEAKNDQLQEAKTLADEWYREACREADKLTLLYDESRAQAARLDRAIAALQSVSEALTNTTHGVDELLQSVASTAAHLLDAEYALVTYGEGAEAKEVSYCAYELPFGTVPALPPARLLDMIAAADRRRVPVTETRASEGGFVTLVCAPMFKDGEQVGHICLQRRVGHEVTDSDLSILQTLANQTATAIENALLFEESQRLQQISKRLYELTLAQKDEAVRKTIELNEARIELSEMQKEQILSDERNRIARELHDNVTQILTSIGLNLEWCRLHLPEELPVAQRITSLKKLARSGIYEIRNAIYELSSVTTLASGGLDEAIKNLVAEFQRITGITTVITVEGQARKFDLYTESAFYRVAQEALYNAFKHAEATNVEVRLEFRQGELELQVTDDGIGIADATIERARQGLTMGLRNMHSRMEEIGGSLAIGRASASGRGTRVTARLSQGKEAEHVGGPHSSGG